jgi:hypothetical protein
MRGLAGFAVVFVVGCVARSAEPPGEPWEGPPMITPPPSSGCHSDAACGTGQVCARTGACMSPDQVRTIHASWTVRSMPANAITCTSSPDLQIEFDSTTGTSARLAYVPVPCAEGKFSVDKAPIAIDHVSLGRSYGGNWQTAKIDAVTGEASLDLPY